MLILIGLLKTTKTMWMNQNMVTIIFHQAVELVEEIIQDARLRARCSTIRGSFDPLLYFAIFTLLIIANKEAHIMKREQIEKGLARLDKFCAENEAHNPMGYYDDNMREAAIRALMEFELEELDYDTKWWLVEDEEEFNELAAEIARGLEMRAKFNDLFEKYYDELEQEEESNEDDTMENL